MKYYSEKLHKIFDSEKELLAEEKAAEIEVSNAKNTCKHLVTEIDNLEVKMMKAYDEYQAMMKQYKKLSKELDIARANEAKAIRKISTVKIEDSKPTQATFDLEKFLNDLFN